MTCRSLKYVIGILSDPVEILTQCLDESKNLNMTVNPTKSQIMTINFLKSTPAFCDLIPSEMLVKHVKLLGVTVSNDLKWDTHVPNIVKQANVSLSIFKLLNKLNCPKIHSLRVYLSFTGRYWNMHVRSGIRNFQMNLVTKSSRSKSVRSGSFTKKAKFHTPPSLKLHALPP